MSNIRTQVFAIVATLLALALSGCATMSGDECATSDWYAIGFEDGERGHTADRFSSHRKACAKHGITADFRAYQEGRDEGLAQFCQPSRGYSLGEAGRSYEGVCDAALEEEFLDAYRTGHLLYELRSSVSSASAKIQHKERELDRIAGDIRAKEALLISDKTTTEERVLLLADLKAMSERTGELEAEIEEQIELRAGYEYELENYQRTVAAYGY